MVRISLLEVEGGRRLALEEAVHKVHLEILLEPIVPIVLQDKD